MSDQGCSQRYLQERAGLETVTLREGMLGNALADVLVAAGVLNADMAFTGPELLMAAEQFAATADAGSQPQEVHGEQPQDQPEATGAG